MGVRCFYWEIKVHIVLHEILLWNSVECIHIMSFGENKLTKSAIIPHDGRSDIGLNWIQISITRMLVQNLTTMLRSPTLLCFYVTVAICMPVLHALCFIQSARVAFYYAK